MTTRTLVTATSPKYMNEDGSVIEMMAQFQELDFIIPFIASPMSPDSYSRLAYLRSMAGEFGPIAPYVAAATPTPEQVAAFRAALAASMM